MSLQADELMTAPAQLGCIDLAADNPDFFSWSAQLALQRDGIVHGLGGWFECELAEEVWMNNSPLSDRAIGRSQVFLAIDEALPVKAGDLLDVTVMARPGDHVIAWTITHPASGRRFSHSTWLGDLLEREQLARSHPEHVPRSTEPPMRATWCWVTATASARWRRCRQPCCAIIRHSSLPAKRSLDSW